MKQEDFKKTANENTKEAFKKDPVTNKVTENVTQKVSQTANDAATQQNESRPTSKNATIEDAPAPRKEQAP